MINIFNIFKKKHNSHSTAFGALSPLVIVDKSDIQKPYDYWDINGKRYAIGESMNVSCQVSDQDRRVYGWTLETRHRYSNGDIGGWQTHYNNKIYQSYKSANDAMLKVIKYGYSADARIMPLYVMDGAEFREYKIDRVLTPDPIKKEYELKAWKVKEDCEIEVRSFSNPKKYKKGTIFIQLQNGSIQQAATRNEITRYSYRRELEDLLKYNILEEFDIKEEKWIHPHLCKELKIKIRK